LQINQNKNIEWIIVDCGSDDGMSDFMMNNIKLERIHYYQTLDYNEYSIPIAKNFAARLSSGDYFFNLDVDNFVSNSIENIKKYNPDGIWCNIFRKGVYGRIGCSKDVFKEVGGYDESFLPAGCHDTDFVKRCELLGYKFSHIDCELLPILNSKEETIKNMNSDLSWKEMNDKNKQKMNKNLSNKIFNPNKKFTNCKFLYNFSDVIELKNNY